MDSWEPRYKFQTAVFEKAVRQNGRIGGMAERQKGLKKPKGLKEKCLEMMISLSNSLTSFSQKKGGTELALGTPKTPKNQLKTISYSVCKTDMFLIK